MFVIRFFFRSEKITVKILDGEGKVIIRTKTGKQETLSKMMLQYANIQPLLFSVTWFVDINYNYQTKFIYADMTEKLPTWSWYHLYEPLEYLNIIKHISTLKRSINLRTWVFKSDMNPDINN